MKIGTREEITDMIADRAYRPVAEGGLDKGMLLKFERATIRVTKVDRKNRRVWGVHVQSFAKGTVITHTGHLVDSSKQPPYCEDCRLPVSETATQVGNQRAKAREEEKDAKYLSDGTRIS